MSSDIANSPRGGKYCLWLRITDLKDCVEEWQVFSKVQFVIKIFCSAFIVLLNGKNSNKVMVLESDIRWDLSIQLAV